MPKEKQSKHHKAVDYTKMGGMNPAKVILARSQELDKIDDLDTLKETLIDIFKNTGGMSEENIKKYVDIVNSKKSLQDLRFFYWRFILAASGLGSKQHGFAEGKIYKFTVTEDCVVILNNQRYLLEAGDTIIVQSKR